MHARRVSLIVSLLGAIAAGGALADIGQVKNLEGEVRIERGPDVAPASVGAYLESGDVVVTGEDGKVGIVFVDNTRMSAGPGSRIELARFRFNPTTHDGEFRTRLEKGSLAVVSGQIAKRSDEAMSVQTPASTLVVRGTRFLVKVE